MTRTDISLYQVQNSYDAIENAYGTRALTLQNRHPEAGESIAIVSGYWRKIYRCQIDSFIPALREGVYTWSDSIRYSDSGCDVIGGTSGSPILDARTQEVIGINNTGNENGERCTDDNPCEIDSSGRVSVHQGTNYGEQTYWLYGCLDGDNQFDWTRQGCKMPAPNSSSADETPENLGE
jgi:hypothetical protein